MSENKLKEEVTVNKENGELVMKENTETFDNFVENAELLFMVDEADATLDKDVSLNDFLYNMMVNNTVGCTLFSEDGDLFLGYLNKNNEVIGYTNLMPDIVNVSHPNEKTIFVEFADGTKEVAHLNEGDVFNLETGILVCVVKKLFSDMNIVSTGSTAYNKIIKYALSKLDATKKARLAEREKEKALKAKKASIKREMRLKEKRQREEEIDRIVEAYTRVINNVTEEATKNLGDSFTELYKQLEEMDKA